MHARDTTAPEASAPIPPQSSARWMRVGIVLRGIASVCMVLYVWSTLSSSWLVTPFIPAAERTLYFKLPIQGVQFHWEFTDSAAFLAGELTLRIIDGTHDRTLVVFRDGVIQPGWEMIGTSRDGRFYAGFSTDQLVRTSARDSLVLTLTAVQDLSGIGPEHQGVLRAGTWQMTGTYSALYGGRLNPMDILTRAGKPSIAFMQCWKTVWPLNVTATVGWMGPLPPEDESITWYERVFAKRGVNRQRCGSHV